MKYLFVVFCLIQWMACKSDHSEVRSDQRDINDKARTVKIPAVHADSAYQFVRTQVEMGPRVPGSDAHNQCLEWLMNKLGEYEWKISPQHFKATTYTGFSYTATNIMASYKPEKKQRILLAAHWDTRFIADQDDVNQNEPILGADDGASGVAVLIEIARIIAENPLDLGVDILLFDAEDQGDSKNNTPNSYCLGSQYWSKNKPANYNPMYGILLDMVGSRGAKFPREGVSQAYAPDIVDKIWKLAQSMGYGHIFVDEKGDAITDDHLYVNRIANIPMIDIINRPQPGQFGHYWHTHEDNMDIIDKNMLRIVGQVVVATLYKESSGAL